MKSIKLEEEFLVDKKVYKFTLIDSRMVLKCLRSDSTTPKKERVKKDKKRVLPKDLQEVVDYFKTKGFGAELAKSFYDYYDASDWHDKNGDPVMNYKQKAISTWFKNNEPKKAVHKTTITSEDNFDF